MSNQCESVFFAGFVKEYVAWVHVEVEHSLFVHFDDESREILQNFAGFFISFLQGIQQRVGDEFRKKIPRVEQTVTCDFQVSDRGGGFESQLL